MARLRESINFKEFALLTLNEDGRFVDGTKVISTNNLIQYFKKHIHIPEGTTDIFVWVHGWRNKPNDALSAARKLFPAIARHYTSNRDKYPKIKSFSPRFVAVCWPSVSSMLPRGYRKIRDRAAAMTEQGEAEYFLSRLLGYLDEENQDKNAENRKVLASKGGHFIHCVGHSFGGRFLTAAILAAATPTPATKKLGGNILKYPYTVDSLCVLQMAVPARGFQDKFRLLAEEAPITEGNGRIALTWSTYDAANCRWHQVTESEEGVGCSGLKEPSEYIGSVVMQEPAKVYDPKSFQKRITNVNATHVYMKGSRLGPGSHGDIWHDETVHLLLTLAERARK